MFKPDYRNLEDCARNKKPARIPLYEHNVDPGVAERITGQPFVHCYFDEKPDYETFFRHFCGFFRDYGYDAVSYECCITLILPDGGALNISTSRYYTPKGVSLAGVGIQPDEEVEMAPEKLANFYTLQPEEDDQLQAALETLRQQIARS